MSKAAVRLMGIGLVLGLGGAMLPIMAPAIAQETGRANTAEDFKSADAEDGFLGSGTSIWDLFHSAGSMSSGAGVVDEGFYRSQSRRINRQAESLRERQRAILEQQAAEANGTPAEAGTAE
ncbi:MAG: hypothetical protein AAGM45_17915 [Cyanobacteria bacterium J06588_5]